MGTITVEKIIAGHTTRIEILRVLHTKQGSLRGPTTNHQMYVEDVDVLHTEEDRPVLLSTLNATVAMDTDIFRVCAINPNQQLLTYLKRKPTQILKKYFTWEHLL